MEIDSYIKIIKANKKYNSICDETIIRIVQNEANKYKSEKDIIKSAKNKLHQISGAFINENNINKAFGLLKNLNEEAVYKILSLHVSSLERKDFINEMYKDIIFIAGNNCSVLDIACGFNPFYMSNFFKKYYAADINIKIIDLLNYFFNCADINGHAFANDILYKIPDIQVNNTFLFKIIPLLEQQKKGYSKILLDRLSSEFFTITFPTKSLSGKNVGMFNFYNNFMKSNFHETEFEYCFIKEYLNELLYIIKRRN